MLWGVHANWPHSHICRFNFNTSFEQKSSSNEAKDSQRDFFPPAGQRDLMSFPWTETSLSTAKARIQAGVNATEQVTSGQVRKDALRGSECSVFRGIQAEAGSAT